MSLTIILQSKNTPKSLGKGFLGSKNIIGNVNILFNIYGVIGVEVKDGTSYRNQDEAKLIVEYVQLFQANGIEAKDIGIITP